MQADDPERSRFTLFSMMKLVAFWAVGCACVAPMLNLRRAGAIGGGPTQSFAALAVWSAVVVPLVWAGLSFSLIRRGAWRDRLILALLLSPVATALVLAIVFLFGYTLAVYNNPNISPEDRIGLPSLALHLATILTLGAAVFFLVSRLIPKVARGLRQRTVARLLPR